MFCKIVELSPKAFQLLTRFAHCPRLERIPPWSLPRRFLATDSQFNDLYLMTGSQCSDMSCRRIGVFFSTMQRKNQKERCFSVCTHHFVVSVATFCFVSATRICYHQKRVQVQKLASIHIPVSSDVQECFRKSDTWHNYTYSTVIMPFRICSFNATHPVLQGLINKRLIQLLGVGDLDFRVLDMSQAWATQKVFRTVLLYRRNIEVNMENQRL